MSTTGHSAVRDRRSWRSPVLIGLLVVAGGMIYSLWLAPWYRHVRYWWLPDDTWFNLAAAHSVARHGLGSIYRSTSLFVATPLFPILTAPVAMLGSHWHLSESFPTAIGRPSMWLLYGPVMMATGILVLHGGRRLARAAGVTTGLWWVESALVPLALIPMAVVFGHGEDVVALALVLWAVAAAIRGRPIAAALMLGAAIASKQWAVLGLPLLVTTSPRGERGRVAAAGVAMPAALIAWPLAVDWTHATKALFGARVFVHAGHAALWVTASGDTVVGTPFRVGAIVLAVVVAWRLRGETSPARLLAGYGLVFLGRVLFEPVVFSYYLGPGLAFLLVHERLTEGAVRRTAVVGTLLLVFFSVDLDRPLWWLTAAVALATLSAPAIANAFPGGPVASLRRAIRASWPRWTAGSPRFLRTAASLARRGTRPRVRVRS